MNDLTVVVPTYNGARYLRATLDSVGAQTRSPAVIVVDDGSDDGSAEIAEAHAAVTRVLRQTNRGVAAARNRGLAVAETEYVAFLDQDDLWHPTRTAVLLDLLASTGAVCVGTTEQAFAMTDDRSELERLGDQRINWSVRWIDAEGEAALAREPVQGSGELSEISLHRLMQGAAAVTTSFAYQREAAIVAGGCAPFVRAGDDHVLNVNVASIYGSIPRLDAPTIYYRVHADATTHVSPLVLPLLTLQLALRHGRALPSDANLGPNLEHLIWQIADLPSMSRSEQHALLTLSTPASSRMRWRGRWAKRALRQSLNGWCGRPNL